MNAIEMGMRPMQERAYADPNDYKKGEPCD